MLADKQKTVLNVGGGSKGIPIPPHYDGWKHELLDLFPKDINEVDYKIPIKDMNDYPFSYEFDAVYSSHVLEHLFLPDVLPALRAFWKILKVGGLVEIRVPDFQAAVEKYIETKNLFTTLYTTTIGMPVTIQDVIYGHQYDINKGREAMAHKCGFDVELLAYLIGKAGFVELDDWSHKPTYDIRITGWKGFRGFSFNDENNKNTTQSSN